VSFIFIPVSTALSGIMISKRAEGATYYSPGQGTPKA
jgi:hypothetical protein